MGREAICQCQWADESAQCKILLETNELIVRGPFGRRVSISSITQVLVEGDKLLFRSGQDQVALELGATLAQSWAKRIATKPPTLAEKLGISSATHLAVIGNSDSEDLVRAFAEAASKNSRSAKNANLAFAVVNSQAELTFAMDEYSNYAPKPAIWIIYPKGPNKPISESIIRSTMRQSGFMDTKVASVSTTHTALRFNRRS